MYLMTRMIKASGIKMVLSGEGSDELFAGYLYNLYCPGPEEMAAECSRKISQLYAYDCLRANKSMGDWGIETRVPFLDNDIVNFAMNEMDPTNKLSGTHPSGPKPEKWVLRDTFRDMLPDYIVDRTKAQFSDAVGSLWIDSLMEYAEKNISDAQLETAADKWSYQTPDTKEAYMYREIFEELGAEVIEFGVNPDGFNINHECGSTCPELAQEMVLKHRADYGVTLDGDGDRVILIDREGNILDGDDLLYILAFSNPNRTGSWSGVVGTLMSNFGLEKAIQQLGYKFVRADVGDKYVSQMLTKKGWMLGGESSGHIICRDLVSTGDGTIAALKVISSLLLLEKDPKEVLTNYKKFPQVNINIPVKNKDIVNDSEIKSIVRDVESDITVGRVLVRASGTENIIRVMVEAAEEDVASKFATDISNLVKSKS